MVFQDPFGSLNPRLTVVQLIAQGPMTHGVPKDEALAIARDLLKLVRLDPAAADRFPHEFSGGQRQRIGIARALALRPDVLVADEPVSALDVSVQAQVLHLLADIRDRLQLTMLFITHDLRVAAQVCDEIAVMRHGEIVERGPTMDVFTDPQHPYTRELLAAVPGRNWIPPDCRDATGCQFCRIEFCKPAPRAAIRSIHVLGPVHFTLQSPLSGTSSQRVLDPFPDLTTKHLRSLSLDGLSLAGSGGVSAPVGARDGDEGRNLSAGVTLARPLTSPAEVRPSKLHSLPE